MENFICFIFYLLVLASSLQLFRTASSIPIPAAENNGDDDATAIGCNCNSTNLMVNGNFLSNWLNPSYDEHRISTLSMTADNLTKLTVNKEVREYAGNCMCTLHTSPITAVDI